MTQEIEPAYVTFEQAKLFYSKGLTRETLKIKSNSVQKPYYNDKGELNGDCSEHIKKVLNHEESVLYPAPEQWQVVEWAFQKYKYSIEAEMNIPESGEYDGCYVFNGIIKGSEDYKLKIFYKSKDYPTREKALSDTISHFLTII